MWACAMVNFWKAEDHLGESVLSLHLVVFWGLSSGNHCAWACATVNFWKEDDLKVCGLSFFSLCPRDWTQVIIGLARDVPLPSKPSLVQVLFCFETDSPVFQLAFTPGPPACSPLLRLHEWVIWVGHMSGSKSFHNSSILLNKTMLSFFEVSEIVKKVKLSSQQKSS